MGPPPDPFSVEFPFLRNGNCQFLVYYCFLWHIFTNHKTIGRQGDGEFSPGAQGDFCRFWHFPFLRNGLFYQTGAYYSHDFNLKTAVEGSLIFIPPFI